MKYIIAIAGMALAGCTPEQMASFTLEPTFEDGSVVLPISNSVSGYPCELEFEGMSMLICMADVNDRWEEYVNIPEHWKRPPLFQWWDNPGIIEPRWGMCHECDSQWLTTICDMWDLCQSEPGDLDQFCYCFSFFYAEQWKYWNICVDNCLLSPGE